MHSKITLGLTNLEAELAVKALNAYFEELKAIKATRQAELVGYMAAAIERQMEQPKP